MFFCYMVKQGFCSPFWRCFVPKGFAIRACFNVFLNVKLCEYPMILSFTKVKFLWQTLHTKSSKKDSRSVTSWILLPVGTASALHSSSTCAMLWMGFLSCRYILMQFPSSSTWFKTMEEPWITLLPSDFCATSFFILGTQCWSTTAFPFHLGLSYGLIECGESNSFIFAMQTLWWQQEKSSVWDKCGGPWWCKRRVVSEISKYFLLQFTLKL